MLSQKLKDEFKEKALMNCVATEKGKAKIDEFHRYYVSSVLNSEIPRYLLELLAL